MTGLIRKEFTQIFRDRALVGILIWAFTVAIYTAGSAKSSDVTDVPTAVYDMCRCEASREFLSHLQPPYFKMVAYLDTESEIQKWLDSGSASIVVVAPPDFKRTLDAGRQATIQVISDGALATSATVSVAYLAAISGNYSTQLIERKTGGANLQTLPAIDERLRVEFNPNMLSSWFTSLLELLNMFTMISLLLTAANLVREKERGTAEHLLVSPARPIEILLAKIIPTVILVLGLSTLSFLLVLRPVFHVPIRGSLTLFYSVAALYVFAMTSMGVAIAVVAKNLAQSIMLMILILQPMVFLSGAWNPPESMSIWMQWLSFLSPLRYFTDFGYGVILKGDTLAVVSGDIMGIVVLGTALFGFSLLWFKRSL